MDDLINRNATAYSAIVVDEDRLRELARDLHLCDGGIHDTDPPLTANWVVGWKVKTMCILLNSLYESVNPKGKATQAKASRSSYGLKHDLERLFQTHCPELSSVHTNWVGNGELILAMAYAGFKPYTTSPPNAFYYLRDQRDGAKNKGGEAKKHADYTEALVKAILRKKVEEHLSASS